MARDAALNASPVRVTRSAEETIALGRELAARLSPPVLVLLSGELGAGKTTLTKGLISGLGAAPEEEVTSPTFTLVHVFRVPGGIAGSPSGVSGGGGFSVYHVDLYRVADFHSLETLGLEDMFTRPAVVIVEWPERLALRAGWPVVRIEMQHYGDDSRRIVIHGL